ncbi:MAG: hypothetical protein KA368_04900 [Acidobacteria bacterium]|nr:hypothetical protein [Acidobacteriota bacterium]
MLVRQSFFHFRHNARALTIISLLLVTAVLSYRHFALIHHHAVNLLYWDQWGFFEPLFAGKRWWELFRWQHGPWRQGAGVLSYLLAELTNWNSRAESFFIGFLVWLAMLAAFWLKWRLFGKLTAYDAAIPLIILTATQFQTYAGAVSSAPTAFPMLLIVLYCLAWTAERRLWRMALVLVFNFLLVNTGYGLLIGAITLGLFVIECWNQRRQRLGFISSLAGLTFSVLTIVVFLYDYNFEHFSSSVEQRVARLWDYPLFAGLMFGRFVRPYPNRIAWFTYPAMALGLGLLLLATVVLFIHLQRVFNQEFADRRINLVTLILVGYGLLFVANAALGRAGMGLNGSQSSRFVTLMIPGVLGLYFHLLTLKPGRRRQTCLIVFLILLLPGHLPLRLGDSHPAASFSRNKRAWKDCFLRTGNQDYCNQLTGFPVLSAMEPEVLQSRINFMKNNRLNLYNQTEDYR